MAQAHGSADPWAPVQSSFRKAPDGLRFKTFTQMTMVLVKEVQKHRKAASDDIFDERTTQLMGGKLTEVVRLQDWMAKRLSADLSTGRGYAALRVLSENLGKDTAQKYLAPLVRSARRQAQDRSASGETANADAAKDLGELLAWMNGEG